MIKINDREFNEIFMNGLSFTQKTQVVNLGLVDPKEIFRLLDRAETLRKVYNIRK